MEVERLLPRPPPLRGNANWRDPAKYCRYHRDHGHNTEECWQLKNEIEKLIQRGRLNQFRGAPEPRRGGDRQPELPQLPPLDPPTVGHINVVEAIGCSSSRLGDEENSASKRAQTGELSFSDDDLQGIQCPHNDALIVSLNLNGYDVSRILVDSGSSVNILYLDVFAKMKLLKENLRAMDSALMGFTGDVVTPEGVVTLTVLAGTWPYVAIVCTEFLVAGLRSPYNAIFERPGLMSLRAAISVPHLAMKFPTEWGVGMVRGSQSMARQCFVTSLQSRMPEVDGLNAREEFAEQRGEPTEELEEIPWTKLDPTEL